MSAQTQVTLFNTETRTLKSSHVPQEFAIFVGLPPSYRASHQRYPVLYVLDGNLEFPLVKSALEVLWLGREVAETIIVGIGYPTADLGETGVLRVRDLTPTARGPGSGGAGDFLKFIREELIPTIDSHYRTDPNLRLLFGDSRGGLFALYALFQPVPTFYRYIIGSPSIWWDEKGMFRLEEEYAASHSDLPAWVSLSAGSLENEQMLRNVDEMARRLKARAYPNLKLSVSVFEGETHYSVIPATISRGLRIVLGTTSLEQYSP